MRIDGFKGLVDRVEVIGAEVRAVRETLENSAPPAQVAREAVEAAQSSRYAAFATAAPVAMAHPLGNLTINTSTGLMVTNDAIDAVIVLDIAELPAV